MNDLEKTQLLLAQEANEQTVQEKSVASQEFFPMLEEEQLEAITGGGLCCSKPQTSNPSQTSNTPQPSNPLDAARKLTSSRTNELPGIVITGMQKTSVPHSIETFRGETGNIPGR